MQIFEQLEDWIKFRQSLPDKADIGFAPTMGNLHIGHLSLFQKSKQENQFTATSLFVNPTQFNRPDDFTHYPRSLEADLELMEKAGVDFCLLPQKDAIYHDGYTYQVQENELCKLMEGQYRPGHFNGVLTIVMKLFNLIKPARAYFGEKDYQQYQLIKGMASAFFMDIQVIGCPTIREESGLACSSRNTRLTPEQRLLADEFAQIFHQKKTCAQIIAELEAKGIQVEYMLDYENRRYAAVFIGDIRLIDNFARDITL
ncbi:pantoate-beta-alanine ligase [Legionella birminghamensis]|uniref:Pantothenate synthetase n=1 Tax=Legionella birminghamensis TaxID=28083 RepID=A0A378I5B4_9GAMM|nr:pantoate--beta-alanine ligase [Legionella birminghamensis]KTC70204.1 pantoate-beta-alanine ligase [Legionella birminghamensis]STX30388.1 pantoate--beta-alanine ligase [Legionella birminghamensis]